MAIRHGLSCCERVWDITRGKSRQGVDHGQSRNAEKSGVQEFPEVDKSQ